MPFMKNLHALDAYRDTSKEVIDYFGGVGDGTCGYFHIPSPIDGAKMKVLASSDMDWDHLSVSRTNRCPNWIEMEHVKRLFFEDAETAMQLHVPTENHISVHPYCLHIWRPQKIDIPLPPSIMVA
jgi:hypothetical protein